MGFGGYQTALCFSRQRGVGVAVLCNAGSDSYELSQASKRWKRRHCCSSVSFDWVSPFFPSPIGGGRGFS